MLSPSKTSVGFFVVWIVAFLSSRLSGAEPLPEVTRDQLPRTAPVEPSQAAATMTVRPSVTIELMASEPIVVDPTALAFDEESRAYVIEMRDYSERRDERLGRVRLLFDDNGDSRFDRSTVFAEDLPWPTGVACWDGGVFVLATPDLYYLKDTDGDGRADLRQLVLTGFGNMMERYNVQALPNSMQWGPDQRIHFALGGNPSRLTKPDDPSFAPLVVRGRDLSFDPRKMDFRTEPGGGQWGMTFDAIGRKFICANNRHIQQVMYPEFAMRINPNLGGNAPDIGVDGPQAEVYRTSPVEPWRVLRTQWRLTGVTPGGVEGGGRASGYFTSACGIHCYRGAGLPDHYLGNFFINDCGSNLIHRKTVTGEVRQSALRAADEQTSEFAASRDNWFRPVAFASAPDGCLWVCDMYRETVEHPWSLPEPIKKLLDLNSGNDRGRLWRFVPDGYQRRPVAQLGRATPSELVVLLSNPNGWHRDTAARLLHQRFDQSVVPQLVELVQSGESPIGRIVGLRVLVGLTPFEKVPWNAAIHDTDASVRAAALLTLGANAGTEGISPRLRDDLAMLARDTSANVRYEVALLLPYWPLAERTSVVDQLCEGELSEIDLRQVLFTQVGDAAVPLWIRLSGSTISGHSEFARQLITAIGQRARPNEIERVFQSIPATLSALPALQALADGTARAGKRVRDLAPAESIQKLQEIAIKTIQDDSIPVEQKIPAYHILGLIGAGDVAAPIVASIHGEATKLQTIAAIDAVDRLNPTDLAKLYLQLWTRGSVDARAHLMQTWRTRKALISDLLQALEDGTITVSLVSPTDIAALRTFSDPVLKQKVETLFGPVGTREAALEKYHPALVKPGSVQQGLVVYRSKCATCHRKQGEGNAVGPDLETVVNMGREKLLTNILDPSREVTIGYATGLLETTDGLTVSGIIVDESAAGVTLKLAGKPPRTWARTEIEEFKRSAKSLMPDGIEQGLSVDEMANLLEFLSFSGKVER